jgi:hypothetical protein
MALEMTRLQTERNTRNLPVVKDGRSVSLTTLTPSVSRLSGKCGILDIAEMGVDARVAVWIREFLIGRSQRVRGSQGDIGGTSRERSGPTSVHSIRKRHREDH